jgi:hypothetical protein
MHLPECYLYHWLLKFMSHFSKNMELSSLVYIPRSGAAEAAHLHTAGIMNHRDTRPGELKQTVTSKNER